MTRILFVTLGFFTVSLSAFSQDQFEARLSEAKTAYYSGNLEDTRFALQQTLAEIDLAIGKEILKMLPDNISGLPYDEGNDEITGSSNSVGVFVNRMYEGEPKSINVNIMDNSPMLAGLTAILSMPLIGGMATDDSQKVIKIAGYKSVLQRDEDEEGQTTGYNIMVPINDTLINVECEGITTEQAALQVANQIPIANIANLLY